MFLKGKGQNKGFLMSFFIKSTAMLLIFSFFLPSFVVFASEDNINKIDTIKSQKKEKTGLSDLENLNIKKDLPSFEIMPSDHSRKEDEKSTFEKEPIKLMASDGGAGKEISSIIPNSKQVSVNQNDGSLSYVYEFIIPPGRNDLTPDISLSYNSNERKNNSIVGYGWSIDIPYIERINKTGSDNLYTDNTFSSSIDGELIVSGLNLGSYQPKIENGNFLSYKFTDNKWVVYDKSGLRYQFGGTSQARQDDIASSTRVYKWMLEEVRDKNDNYIRYEYFKNSGQIYPEHIFYTGNGATDGIFQVDFNLEATTTSPTMYSTDFAVKNNYQISEIVIKENNQWVRKYDFSYKRGDAGFRRLLESITESGIDLVSDEIKTKEPTVFVYKTKDSIGWTQVENSDWELPRWLYDEDSNDPTFLQFADLNGDSYVDVLHYERSPVNCETKNVFINDTHGSWITYHGCGENWNIPIYLKYLYNGFPDYGTRSFDYNGDMLPDLVRSFGIGTSTPTSFSIFKNDGPLAKKWDSVSSGDLPIGFVFGQSFADNGTEIVDFNGDGIQDVVYGWQDDDDPNPFLEETYIGDGYGNWSSTTNSSQWNLPYAIVDENEYGSEVFTHAQISDINEDGLVDMFFRWSTPNGSGQKTYINNGHNWNEDDDIDFWYLPFTTEIVQHLSEGHTDSGTRVSDINGDGIKDLYQSVKDSTPPYNISCAVFVNTLNEDSQYNGDFGLSFIKIESPAINCPESFSYGGGITDHAVMFDANADGMEDVFYSTVWDDEVVARSHLNKGTPFTDLLVGIETPEGATSSVSYKLSSKYFDDNDNLLNPALPILVTTVDSIKNNDGFGNISSENYVYADGFYYYNGPRDRKFAGFGEVDKTDALGNVTKSYFHQGNETSASSGEYDDHISKMGKPYLVEQYDSSGNLFSKTINKWDRVDLGNGASFVNLIQTLNFTYDGDSDHREKAASYSYDSSNGNLTQKISWGEVSGNNDGSFTDVGTDKITTNLSYASDVDNKMFLQSREFVTDQSGATVKDTKSYYDNLSFGQLQKGNQTKQEMLKSGSSYIDVEKTYNSYGLVTQEKDPRDKTTTYSYDSFNLYPVTTTNPLGQTTTALYDYSIGKPKQIEDSNGSVYQILYDGLDRVSEEKQSDISNPSTLVTKTKYEYIDNEFPSSVIKTDYLTSSISIPTYTYLDGLGRTIQERHKAEDSNVYTVKDTVYGLNGLKSKESLPYFSTGSSRTNPTTNNNLWNNFTYDALGRIKTIANVVGTTTNTYDDWKLTVTDANDKSKDLYKDAQGNLVQVDEHNSGDTYSTYYEWNPLGNLTKITDALGNIRNFTYDKLGRRLTAEDLHFSGDSNFSTWNYAYDDAGNMTYVVDGKNQTINYAYDDLNRPLSEDFDGQKDMEVSYSYDSCVNGIGRLCFATTTSSASSYVYDPLGRTVSETKNISGNQYQTTYEYDRQGNQTIITTPDGAQTKYDYNSGGMIEKISRKESGAQSFVNIVDDLDYSPEGKVAYQYNHNDTNTTNTYDANHLYRLTDKFTDGPLGGITSVLQDLHYTYDNVGNITQLSDTSETNNSKNIVYTYDDLSRLKTASSTYMGAGPSYREVYTYGPTGNILSKAWNNDSTTYQYSGAVSAKLQYNPQAVSSALGLSFDYDANGNMTNSGGDTITWNYKNQMIGMTVGATTTTYAYDHAGERVKYTNGIETTIYPNRYYNIATTTSTTTTTSHIFLGDTMVATVEKVGNNTPKTYYIHTDHLSGANISTDKDGLVTEVTDFYPYGTQRFNQSYNSTFKEQRKFTGHEYDEDTGLNYMGARYQNSNAGRFTSLDPVFLAVGNADQLKQKTGLELQQYLADPQGLNSYGYARNNPLVLVDKSGNYFETAFDLTMFAWSLHDFKQNPGLGTGFSVFADGLSVALPIPAVVGVIRHGDDAADFLGFLRKSDNLGGHTLREHVGKSADDLLARFNDSKFKGKFSSSFHSEAVGDFATHQNIQMNLDKISQWMADPTSGRLSITASLSEDIGFGVDRAGNMYNEVMDVTTALRKTPDGKSFYAKTSFPQVKKLKPGSK